MYHTCVTVLGVQHQVCHVYLVLHSRPSDTIVVTHLIIQESMRHSCQASTVFDTIQGHHGNCPLSNPMVKAIARHHVFQYANDQTLQVVAG